MPELLDFNVSWLKFMTLWPESGYGACSKSFFKYYVFLLSQFSNIIPIFADMVYQLMDNGDLINVTENIIALAAFFGMIYMSVCFIKNRNQMKYLVEHLNDFNIYGNRDFVETISRKSKFYSKSFMYYGIIGNLCYASIPLILKSKCNQEKINQKSKSVKCGLITRVRLPIDVDYSPMIELEQLLQMYSCLWVSLTVLSITMFLCSILMHVVGEIQNLQQMFRNVCEGDPTNYNKMHEKLRICVEYHQCIIRYSDKMKTAFSSMMLVHMTLTAFVISVLGFEVIMVNNQADSLRFGMHLGGWLLILMLTCYFGHKLIEESNNIIWNLYCTPWFQCPTKLRKDIIFIMMRSHKPLRLTASSLGTMSLQTFLSVMSSSYSYFTLLLKIKK